MDATAEDERKPGEEVHGAAVQHGVVEVRRRQSSDVLQDGDQRKHLAWNMIIPSEYGVYKLTLTEAGC